MKDRDYRGRKKDLSALDVNLMWHFFIQRNKEEALIALPL